MARQHSGGFVNPEFYFNIGTDAARGRDGDTARLAAQKYNDHRHSAYMAVSTNDLRNWKNEVQTASAHPDTGGLGGILQDSQEFLRRPGDLAELNSILYAATSTGVKSISSGFGVHVDMQPNVPQVVEDKVAANFTMLRGAIPLQGIDCLFALDQGFNVPLKTTVGDCVLYESVRAHSGDLETHVLVAAAVKLSSGPALVDGIGDPIALTALPVIGILLTPKYYPTVNHRILSSQVVEGPSLLITSITGQPFQSISNSGDLGHTIANVLTLPSHFEGRIELEMSFDVDTCYTPAEYASEAFDAGLSVDELKSAMCTWAENNVRLDLLDATARVLCTFRGQ